MVRVSPSLLKATLVSLAVTLAVALCFPVAVLADGIDGAEDTQDASASADAEKLSIRETEELNGSVSGETNQGYECTNVDASEADSAFDDGCGCEPQCGPNDIPLAATLNLDVQAHVQTYGWVNQTSVPLGDVIEVGTTGRSKRIEAFALELTGNATGYKGGIAYRAHVQTYGWQDWVFDGAASGTSGEAKRLEAIEVVLTGELAEHFDIYYCVHAQTYGWLGWAKNGERSGTSGLSKRLEAVRIVLVEKNSDIELENDLSPYFDESIIEAEKLANASVAYRAHVQTYGWQGLKFDGEASGTSGESKRLEAIEISLGGGSVPSSVSGGITYRTHVQTYGWQDWASDGEMAGTSGESKRLEAIEIKLSGDIADLYDVYYRVHAQYFGWMGWAKNGASAGSAGYSYRLEAIQIVLVEKGASAPGSASGAFYEKSNPTGSAGEFVSIALAEPDGRPEGGNSNKYTGYHYNAWCAYFVSWCARQAGVSTSTIPEIYLCSTLKGFYQTKGRWHTYSYTPQAGDLIFYSTYSSGSPSHVGIVTSRSNGIVHTKEGNVGDGVVGSRTRIVGSSYVASGWYIVGYASPF